MDFWVKTGLGRLRWWPGIWPVTASVSAAYSEIRQGCYTPLQPPFISRTRRPLSCSHRWSNLRGPRDSGLFTDRALRRPWVWGPPLARWLSRVMSVCLAGWLFAPHQPSLSSLFIEKTNCGVHKRELDIKGDLGARGFNGKSDKKAILIGWHTCLCRNHPVMSF